MAKMVFGNWVSDEGGRKPSDHKFTGEKVGHRYRTLCGILQPIFARAMGNEDRFVSCGRCRRSLGLPAQKGR